MNKATLVICGCRDAYLVESAIKEVIEGAACDQVFVGDATGVDQCVRDYCRKHEIPCTVYAASKDFTDPDLPVIFASDWRQDGRAAGPIRNRAMIKAANDSYYEGYTQMCAFWDGRSPGTLSCIRTALHQGVRRINILSVGNER